MIFNACKKYNTPSKTTHQKTPSVILLKDSVLFFIFSKVSFKCDKVIFKQNAVYLNFNAVIADCHIKFVFCQFN